jgi:pyruvate dehydrogenase E2 component (dihydrolipoamide acetyltransferase)
VAPEAEAPEAKAPEAETPEAETPEAEAPEARAPEARAPEAETPEARAPEVESAVPGGKARASAAAVAVSAVLEQALEGRAAPRVGERADVNAALLRELAAGPPYRIEPPRLLRRVVAATVSRALAAPQFRISTQVDLTGLKDYAARRKASFTLLIARACALTVREQPDFNAAWTADGLARRERVDVAIAMEAEHGLLSPVVRDVAGRSFAQLSEDWRALKENVERHRMAPEAYRGGTFYVSNLGMFPGIVQFDAIVPPGAAAILAVAAPGGQGTLLTLTCDHRVVFGADAARFLAALAERLARPEEWAE